MPLRLRNLALAGQIEQYTQRSRDHLASSSSAAIRGNSREYARRRPACGDARCPARHLDVRCLTSVVSVPVVERPISVDILRFARHVPGTHATSDHRIRKADVCPPFFLTRPPRRRHNLTPELGITQRQFMLFVTNRKFGTVPRATTCIAQVFSMESGGGGMLRNA